jgi:membrane dipeptidase
MHSYSPGFLLPLFSCLFFWLGSCTSPSQTGPSLAQATALTQRFIIADGHIDVPYRIRVAGFRLQKEFLDVSVRTEDGHFDYPRAQAGGLDAPFMSIYIPSDLQQTQGKSYALGDSLIDIVERMVREYPDKFALAYSPADIEANFATRKISLPMGMENGSPVENDLANLTHFYQRGIRYITLTHAKDNQICDSSYDTTYTWNGLSPFGEAVVAEMNRLGIMVDISHVSDSAFFDVISLTRAPVIASHSSCRYFTPGFERNMNDEMIRSLGENGGVIHINFGSYFTGSLSADSLAAHREEIVAWMEEQGASYRDSAYLAYVQKYWGESDNPAATVQIVADHIDHVVQLVGVEHVAFGSDFDGVSSVPVGISDASMYPNLVLELLKRGYSEAEIEMMGSGNLFRVWRRVEELARERQAAAPREDMA